MIPIAKPVMGEPEAEAARRGETVTALIERGLRLVLASASKTGRRPKIVLPVSQQVGGTLPGVDLNDSAALLDIMEERR